MKKTLAAALLAGAVVLGTATPALADPVIVDEPDTSELHNIWTFTPVLGIPVLGLIQSVVKAPNGIIPN